MRWRWCEAVLVLAAVSACAPMARRWYVPNAGEDQLALDDARQAADLALRDECPRLMGSRASATGEALIVVDVDRTGRVLRARIERSSGDPRVDDLFGTLATRLRLDRPTGMVGESGEGTVGIGFSCSPKTAIATIRLNPE